MRVEDGRRIGGRATWRREGIGKDIRVVGRMAEVLLSTLLLEFPLLIGGRRRQESKEVLGVAFFFLLLDEGVIVGIVTAVIERAGGGARERGGVGSRG